MSSRSLLSPSMEPSMPSASTSVSAARAALSAPSHSFVSFFVRPVTADVVTPPAFAVEIAAKGVWMQSNLFDGHSWPR